MHLQKPLVSVLIPIYNTEKYILQCAESVFNQTYDNLEIIFFDDKSPDDSISILEKYIESQEVIKTLPKIKIIRSEYNVGLPGARNESLKYVSGEYICFIDSDDLIPKDSIEILINKAIETNADIVRGQFEFLGEDGSLVKYNSQSFEDKTEYIQKLINWGTLPMTVWGAIYKSDFIQSSGIKFNTGHNMGEDYSFISRISYLASTIRFVDKVVYHYRVNPISITHNFNSRKADDLLDNYYIILDFYKGKHDYELYKRSLEVGYLNIRNFILYSLPIIGRIKYAKKLDFSKSIRFISYWGILKSIIVIVSPQLFIRLNRIDSSY